MTLHDELLLQTPQPSPEKISCVQTNIGFSRNLFRSIDILFAVRALTVQQTTAKNTYTTQIDNVICKKKIHMRRLCHGFSWLFWKYWGLFLWFVLGRRFPTDLWNARKRNAYDPWSLFFFSDTWVGIRLAATATCAGCRSICIKTR